VTDTPEPKTPLDQALDVFVFLPVGFVVDFPRSVPRYIDCGRRQLEVALRGLGVSPFGPSPSPSPSPSSDREAAPATESAASTSTAASAAPPTPRAGRLRSVATGAPPAGQPLGPVVPVGPTIDPAILAIPDYDSLSASQVVPRLDSLSVDELETVRQYEESKRRRKTILGKVAQLQAG
jgi:hypothetical protein